MFIATLLVPDSVAPTWVRLAQPVLLLVAAAAIPVGACNKARSRETSRIDALSQRYLDSYAAIAMTMAQVTDVESAKEAVPRIKELQRDMKEVDRKMGTLSSDYRKHFSRKFGKMFMDIRKKMVAERKRITSLPAVDAVFSEAMRAEPTPAG